MEIEKVCKINYNEIKEMIEEIMKCEIKGMKLRFDGVYFKIVSERERNLNFEDVFDKARRGLRAFFMLPQRERKNERYISDKRLRRRYGNAK